MSCLNFASCKVPDLASDLRRHRQCLPPLRPIGRSGPPDQDYKYARLHLACTLPLDIFRDLLGATIRDGRENNYLL
eukprot:6204126-Pleurochrysis_carterae.AAC.1